jgi:hypothetical protein
MADRTSPREVYFRQPKKARAAFKQGITSGHPDYAPAVANRLGLPAPTPLSLF